VRGILFLLLSIVVGVAIAAPDTRAQDATETRIEPYDLPQNDEYRTLMRFKRTDVDLVYIDELEGEIPMDGVILRPVPEEDPEDSGVAAETMEISSRIILLFALISAAFLLWRNKDGLLTLMGKPPSTVRQATQNNTQTAAPVAQAADLSLIDRLRAMADREAALVMLLQAALSAVWLWQKSWCNSAGAPWLTRRLRPA